MCVCLEKVREEMWAQCMFEALRTLYRKLRSAYASSSPLHLTTFLHSLFSRSKTHRPSVGHFPLISLLFLPPPLSNTGPASAT